jgi:hypothetical protein
VSDSLGQPCPRAAVSTSVLMATGAARELLYLRLGGGRSVVLLHPLRRQLEYFSAADQTAGHRGEPAGHRGQTADAPVGMRPLSRLDRPGQVAKLIEGVLR